MNVKIIKGSLMLTAAGVFLIAAVVLVLMNLGNTIGNLSFYWRTINGVKVALVMLISAGVGAVTPMITRLLFRGIRDLRGGRLQQKVEIAAKAAQQGASPAAESQEPGAGDQ
jgi:hypothetical protein